MDKRIEIKRTSATVTGRAIGGRPTQQDDLICLHDADQSAYLLVLADGMGGHGAGELASRLVIETASQLWFQGSWKTTPGALFLEQLCQQAHQRLRASHGAATQAEPHSTVVALLVKGGLAYWVHVGDSRLYRFQGRRLLGCTQDHSVLQQQAATQASAEASDAQQYMLLRGLGGTQAPTVEHGCMPARSGQTFVLCSDGVWAQLSAEELRHYVQQPQPEQALEQALALALQRGGSQGDNVSLIFLRLGGSTFSLRRFLQAKLARFGHPRSRTTTLLKPTD